MSVSRHCDVVACKPDPTDTPINNQKHSVSCDVEPGTPWAELTPELKADLLCTLAELQQEHPNWGSRRLRTAICDSGKWTLGYRQVRHAMQVLSEFGPAKLRCTSVPARHSPKRALLAEDIASAASTPVVDREEFVSSDSISSEQSSRERSPSSPRLETEGHREHCVGNSVQRSLQQDRQARQSFGSGSWRRSSELSEWPARKSEALSWRRRDGESPGVARVLEWRRSVIESPQSAPTKRHDSQCDSDKAQPERRLQRLVQKLQCLPRSRGSQLEDLLQELRMLVSTPDECCLIFRLRDDFKWVSSLDGAVNTLLDHVVRHGHNELLLWSLGALMCESDEAVVDSWIEKKRNSEWFGKRCGSCEEALADVSNKCSSCHRPKFASMRFRGNGPGKKKCQCMLPKYCRCRTAKSFTSDCAKTHIRPAVTVLKDITNCG